MNTLNLNLTEQRDYYTSEAYKALRTNLQFCGTDVKVIALTSCLPNEGKSTVSIGVAQEFAKIGKKVLLIDADLRKSTMVRKYVTDAGISGLSDYLAGQCEADDAMYHTQFTGFDIIFAGKFPPNPVELLGSSRFKAFIESQKQNYDYILVDTPPLGLVIDCAVISGCCDSAVMVISKDRIHASEAIEVKNQLLRSGVHILGVVFNEPEVKKHIGSSKKDDYRYNRYYSNRDGKGENSQKTE